MRDTAEKSKHAVPGQVDGAGHAHAGSGRGA